MNKVRVNDISLAYERSGEGLPLLLIHGFPLDHGFWTPLLPYLESSFDLILPDLPGFGSSDVPEGDLTIEQMAAVLAALLDELKIPQAYVAGHSMGGYVALAFAHAFPQKVLGLGLLGSQAAPDSPERKAGRYDQAQQVVLQGTSVVLGMAEKLSADASLAPFFREIILRQPAGGIINALKAMAGRPDATRFLGSFNFPVLLMHGLSDGLIPVERSREMKVLVPGAQLIELPGVGHSSAPEAPLETAQALLRLSGR